MNKENVSIFKQCRLITVGAIVKSVFIKKEYWDKLPKEFHNHILIENDTDKKLLYFDFDIPPVSYSEIANVLPFLGLLITI